MMDGGHTFIEAEAEAQIARPLFIKRAPHQCCWPMWGDTRVIETKLVCGDAVQAGSKVPYCAEHLKRQRGAGTPSEQTAVRATLAITKRRGI